jgi:hypothetical protein
MSDLDLRDAFAKLCADRPAGDAGGVAYEETLGLAVQHLVRRTFGHRAGFSAHPIDGTGSPALDCPFVMSVAVLSVAHAAQCLH